MAYGKLVKLGHRKVYRMAYGKLVKLEYLGPDGEWHEISTLEEKVDNSIVRKFGSDLGIKCLKEKVQRTAKFRMIRLCDEQKEK
ncbi:hypothetical protein A2Z67_04600 [Candidatus Woesebacteria bacterium RBG_13_36_22]|uniref:Uncharacterized protein n=1 Tax=Candidatus Woesebacteria bacterium RBG_13_36_22 TaxID=1802478 RepID=A0A1F7X281_9BACT|nr:MAG: hypothetical protein A2Z67_04600 [Candidatus Woesebacteria bacterium RBG_13_36_22]